MFDIDQPRSEEEAEREEHQRRIYLELVPDLVHRGLLDPNAKLIECAILDAVIGDLFSK